MISKGFQHQFWQAVKAGAEKAAADFNVRITFEGPESESQVDKQIEMLQTALGRNPKALAFAALDSKAAIPLLEKAKAQNIPVIGFDSGVDSDIPVTTAATDNIAAAGLAADSAARKAMEHGMRQVSVFVRGPGAGRESAVRALQAIGLELTVIRDVTPVPHTGCRPPKQRRV